MSYDEHLISMAGGDGEPRIEAGTDIDEGGTVTIQHRTSVGEVIIRRGESIIAAVDAGEFFAALEKLP